MSELTYMHQGKAYTKAELDIILKGTKKKTKSEAPEAYHRGYRVVGHKPGAMERAKEAADFAVQRWINTHPADRTKLGLKQPKPWDEIAWRRNAPKTTIKAFDIASAADLAASIAKRDGWTEVEVIELKKGERPEGWA